ncbi:MAG: ATP-binding protein [Candidatus Aminicenantes bacterium]|jgi:anti-sigma regulatory factor (Ser/Thr protein kinase)|nr:ATP-binding protein [Candidatus Aminicenantes bacterium]
MKTLTVKSNLAELNKIRAFLKANLSVLSISENDYYTIELSLLEICVNIIRYAYPEDRGEIHLRTWKDNKRFYLEISDEGVPFDPRQVEEPDVEKIISNGQKGGFGIFIARKLMDGFNYKREKDRNILTIYKTIT